MHVHRLIAWALAIGLLSIGLPVTSFAQMKWYKFSKDFIDASFAPDSAIGTLKATNSHAAQSVHSVNCGGNDGELHVGIAGDEISWNNLQQLPTSAPADDNDEFGIVVEPVNVASSTKTMIANSAGHQATFIGYFRVWNEGHDSGNDAPSNPHHVVELHPAWGFESGQSHFDKPSSIFAMPGYHGYGATKFKVMFQSAVDDEWPKVYEDNDFVYVQIAKAENFYQLPVRVKSVSSISGGKQAQVDVYSAGNHQKLVYKNLSVIALNGTEVVDKLVAGKNMFLLGIFSVNLRKAMALASGVPSETEAVYAPAAVEFFAYGVPKGKAVVSSSSSLCN